MTGSQDRGPGRFAQGHHLRAPEVFIALRLLGDFDPTQITNQIGLEPSFYFTKGQLAGNGPRVYQQSCWRLDSEAAVRADTIEPHLDWLLELIEPKAANLAATRASGITLDVDCYWESVGMSGGPWISPQSMSRLGALGLPLVISFYAVGPPRDRCHRRAQR